MFFDRFLSEIYRNIHVFLLLPLAESDVSDASTNDSTPGWNVNDVNPTLKLYSPMFYAI